MMAVQPPANRCCLFAQPCTADLRRVRQQFKINAEFRDKFLPPLLPILLKAPVVAMKNNIDIILFAERAMVGCRSSAVFGQQQVEIKRDLEWC